MMTLLQRYLAYQRDIGLDEVIFAQPWVDPTTKKSVPKPSPSPELAQVENAQAYLRNIAENLALKNAGKPDSAPISEPKSATVGAPKSQAKPKEIPAAAPMPLAELPAFSDLSAFRQALLTALPGLHPMPRGTAAPSWILGQGPGTPVLAVVLMQPNPDAKSETGPAAGAEGELLGRMLKAIRLDMGNLYVTSLMRARHPGRGWARKDVVRLIPWLAAELRWVRPQVILALGEDTAQALIRLGSGYETLRQKVHEFAGFEMAMTLDPAQLLSQEDKKRDAWKDLQWLMQCLREKDAST